MSDMAEVDVEDLKDTTRFAVRLPADLSKSLRAKAQSENRTMTSYVEAALRASLAGGVGGGEPTQVDGPGRVASSPAPSDQFANRGAMANPSDCAHEEARQEQGGYWHCPRCKLNFSRNPNHV